MNSATYNKNYTPWVSEFYSMDTKLVQYLKINQSNLYYQAKEKTHMIISTDVVKAFNKIQ